MPVFLAAAEPGDDRASVYRQYREAFDAGNYTQALPLASRVVELTGNQFGADALELANPLTNLATTLYRMKEYGEALDAYRRALTILETSEDPTDRRLVAPLHGLGVALRGLDRDEEAIVPLKRAVDVLRNRDGLHTPAQLPILRTLIECFEVTGRNEDAGREHRYAYNVAEQAFGADDPRMIEPLENLAGWYEKIGRYSAARLLHLRAVTVADKEKPDSLKAVEPLRGIARTYRLAFVNGETPDTANAAANDLPQSVTGGGTTGMPGGIPMYYSGGGERALVTALLRLEAAGSAQAAKRGVVLVDLGDWYRIAGAGQRALSSWRDAWTNLNAAGDTSLLDKPAPVIYRPPQMAVSQRREDLDEYRQEEVTLRIHVAADGDVKEVTVANPAAHREAAERAVSTAVRRATWRPAIAGGQPVADTDFTFTEKVWIRRPDEESAASR